MTDGRGPGGDIDGIVVAIGGLIIAAVVNVRAGASLAAFLNDGSVGGGLSDWLIVAARLGRGDPPAEAWGELATGLPSPWLYWTCTGVVLVGMIVVAVALWRIWRRLSRSGERRRFGQPTEAREARRADLVPLAVKGIIPPTGRMLLGRVASRRQVLATEDRIRHPLPKKHQDRQGHRGSVALIGPTGSGKTALAASAIATWDGPVVAVSVKRDLFDVTASVRSRCGEIAVFDPGGATGMPSARWSPLEHLSTSSAALRTGRALAQAIPRSGVTNSDYWASHGENLLGAFMEVATLSRLLRAQGRDVPRVSLDQLATWVTTMAGNTEPTINLLIRSGLEEGQDLEVRLIARHAAIAFDGFAKEDHKVRSSVYTTAALALNPWLEPSVAHSASDSPRPFYSSTTQWEHKPQMIDLEWLMSGEAGRSNTLYLTASQPEFQRLSPVLGGLLADLKDSIHEWDIAGRQLEKPLMIVIDEAGQLELGWLPGEVSTIAALGAFFVTCWQSLAQMQHRYDTLADAVLSGHRTKCFFAGVDDLATARYATTMLGHERVHRRSWSKDRPKIFGAGGPGRDSISESEQREEFAPVNTIRQMKPGEAVLLHGTLPPIHLRAVRWWNERRLRQLIGLGRGQAVNPPAGLVTCPVTSTPPQVPDDRAAERTFTSALATVPRLQVRPATVESTPSRDVSDGTEAVAICERCRTPLRGGEARYDRRGARLSVTCAPTCAARLSAAWPPVPR
ncbi:MAG: type IV secretory system conjugative DNA transfer family protein [Ilumatobacteraceae bacterium]